MFYNIVRAVIFTPTVGWILRPRLVHGERIPKKGAAILACNHTSTGDVPVLGTLIRRKLHFAGKRELFEMRGLKAIVGPVFKALGQVPLDRSGGSRSVSGLQPLLDVLEQGQVVGFFPEGTRSPDGRLYRSHTGIARLALASGAPVIPVGLVNIEVRRSFILPTMRHARAAIGEPLDFSAYSDCANDAQVLRWVTDEIARHIQALSGQTYVDVYGSQIKKGDLSVADVEQFVKAHPNFGVLPPDVTAPVEEP